MEDILTREEMEALVGRVFNRKTIRSNSYGMDTSQEITLKVISINEKNVSVRFHDRDEGVITFEQLSVLVKKGIEINET